MPIKIRITNTDPTRTCKVTTYNAPNPPPGGPRVVAADQSLAPLASCDVTLQGTAHIVEVTPA